MVELSIIVLNYNTRDLTIKCLESINKQYSEQLESRKFEIIIVDNNSTDGSVEAIQSFLRSRISLREINFKLIKNEENVGFSKGNNIGAEKANGKYLFFLNSDTEVKDKGLLGMVDLMEKNGEIGILGARLKNIDGSNQNSVGKFYNLINVFIMLFGGERAGLLRLSPKKISKVDWTSGAALMIRKDIFHNLNGFDENFFMYMEDMELCFRIKKKGLDVQFYPDIGIIHKERGSSDKTFAIVSIYKGLLYFYKKHKSFWQFTLVKIFLIIKAVMAILIGFFSGNKSIVLTYKKALNFVI